MQTCVKLVFKDFRQEMARPHEGFESVFPGFRDNCQSTSPTKCARYSLVGLGHSVSETSFVTTRSVVKTTS